MDASFEILNSGSVFLKYLNTAEDLEDQSVILGFLSTISLTSATCSSCILISCGVCKSSSLRTAPDKSSDAWLFSSFSLFSSTSSETSSEITSSSFDESSPCLFSSSNCSKMFLSSDSSSFNNSSSDWVELLSKSSL